LVSLFSKLCYTRRGDNRECRVELAAGVTLKCLYLGPLAWKRALCVADDPFANC
jgi:hypothetical protein